MEQESDACVGGLRYVGCCSCDGSLAAMQRNRRVISEISKLTSSSSLSIYGKRKIQNFKEKKIWLI